ncbi:MAG: DNA-processing protein DprA [Wujia sp.]
MRNQDMMHLWFDGNPAISLKLRQYLLARFGSVEALYEMDAATLLAISQQVGYEEAANRLLERRNVGFLESQMERLDKHRVTLLYEEKNAYPDKLRHIYDSPRLLYAVGKLDKSLDFYNQNLAIVGARNADTYHRETTRVFARELAKNGIHIISGLARGIDSEAHIGCLEGKGYTVAVLGCGINVTYPKEHISLYERIKEEGLVLSEYGLDVAPNPFQFPARNRIISGLSDGVLVTCAKKKSGSLITADLALEQGKQVYAFPGRIMDALSEGNNDLIKMGALCVTKPEDILLDLWGEEKMDFEPSKNTKEEEDKKNNLAPEEKLVYSCLDLDPVFVDELVKASKLGVSKTISVLYGLETKGLVKQTMRGYYIKNI